MLHSFNPLVFVGHLMDTAYTRGAGLPRVDNLLQLL